MEKSGRLKFWAAAAAMVAWVAFGGWFGNAFAQTRQMASPETPATAQAAHGDDAQQAAVLRHEVERQIAIFQRQLAAATRGGYSIPAAHNLAGTAWTAGSARARSNRVSRTFLPLRPQSSLDVFGTPLLGVPAEVPQDNVFVWESPSMRRSTPNVEHSPDGWTIITPGH